MKQRHLQLNHLQKHVFPVLLVCVLFITIPSPAQEHLSHSRLLLHHGWQIQSSCEVKSAGSEVSSAGFSTKGWHRAETPTTVVAALVADKTYPDPYFGMNLKSFPGMDYSPTEFFANQEMPQDSPFRCSWWYRTEFNVPAAQQDKATWLHFDALNYRANVWLNGQKIADAHDVAGTFRVFEFKVSKQLLAGKSNVLAVEVFAPDKGDLGITWVDWNPTPPDKDMGLWKDVYITTSGDIALRAPFVSSKLGSDYSTAALTISADLRNASDHAVSGILKADIEGIHVSQPVELGPAESKTVTFAAEQYPQLKLDHPRLWWPYQMGAPEMYTARLSVESGGRASDSAEVHFGVREVTSELTPQGHRLFRNQRAQPAGAWGSVGARHASALVAGAGGRFPALRACHESKHGSFRGAHGARRILRHGRPPGNPHYAGLDLL